MVSAPFTHRDVVLIGQASHKWEIAVQLLGRAVTTFYDVPNGNDERDDVFSERMWKLMEAARLRSRAGVRHEEAYRSSRP